jgi:carotenoid cleavage dioxygenase-like enzyme
MDFAANTNVIGHAGRTLALVEAGALPVELGYCLDTVGPTTFGDSLPGGYTAHPKRHPGTGELHAISYFPGWGPFVQYSVTGLDGLVYHATEVAVGGLVSIHDTAITERFIVVYDLPVVLSGEAIGTGYATAFTTRPDGQASILKHDLLRGTTTARPIGRGSGPAEPVFVPRSADAAEDEGWLLCLSYDRERDASDLLILAAADITAEPEAIVHLPVRVPVGFHGNWVEDDIWSDEVKGEGHGERP